MTEPIFYIYLAYDPTKSTIFVAGFAKEGGQDRMVKSANEELGDAAYRKLFCLSEANCNMQIAKWANECGIPRSKCANIVRGVGRSVLQCMGEVE